MSRKRSAQVYNAQTSSSITPDVMCYVAAIASCEKGALMQSRYYAAQLGLEGQGGELNSVMSGAPPPPSQRL